MVIGSFTNNAQTSTLQVPGSNAFSHAYYYFDAVVVEEIGEVQSVYDKPVIWFGSGWLSVRWPATMVIEGVTLWDIHGRRVQESSVRERSTQVSVDVNELARGTYVVEVTGADRRAVAKWTKVD